MNALLISSLILSVICAINAQDKKVVCYWNSNSHYHAGLKGEFHASNIDPNICTHIIYTYIRFSVNFGLFWSLNDKTEEFLNLKTRNSNVKLLIGVGGPQWGSQTPSEIVSTNTGRYGLADAINKFLNERPRFDGVDIDWQYPAQGMGQPADFDNYPRFLSILREKIPAQKSVSISVATRNEDIQKSYDVPRIVDIVDFVNLNSFDFRGMGGDSVTVFHSPYSKDPNDRTAEAEWNAQSIVNSWLTRASPAKKLTLGIATYGRSLTLTDPDDHDVGSPVSGIGRQSAFLNMIRPEKFNVIPYAEICWNLIQEGTQWKSFWSQEHFAPYAVYDIDQWVGYDNEKSVLAKIHLVLDNDLGGINFASIDYEDFAGRCGSNNSLINLGYEAMINGNFPPNPVEPTTTTPLPGATDSSSTITDEITLPGTSSTETTTTETEPEVSPETTTTTEPTPTPQPEPTEDPTTSKKTTRSTTTTEPFTGTIDFQTPPVTPETSPKIEDPVTATTPENVGITDEITSTKESTNSVGSTQSVQETTTTKDFKTPPVTPLTSEPTKEDSNEVTNDGSLTTEGGSYEEGSGESSEEGSGESSEEGSGESYEYSSSEEGSTESPEDGTTAGSEEEPDDTTVGNNSGEVTDDGSSTDGSTLGTSTLPDDTVSGPQTPPDENATGSTVNSDTTTEGSNFVCPRPNGNFRNPANCSQFFICSNNIPYLFNCQEGLYYDEAADRCDYSASVQCNI